MIRANYVRLNLAAIIILICGAGVVARAGRIHLRSRSRHVRARPFQERM